MQPSFLRGIWVPLVTPFAAGAVDHAGLRRLTGSLARAGIAGFVVCGSTGEAATLDDAEQQQVLKTVLEAAQGLPVLMGLSGVATHAVRDKLLRRAELPVSGFLVTAPHYVKPSQAGLVDHFSALADASSLPIVLYDIPGRTGVRIETPTMLQLAAHPRILGVKDCSSDLDHLQAIIADGRLAVLCGNDAQMFASMGLGGTGAIAAAAHLRPELFVMLHRAFERSDLAEARALWKALWPLAQAVFAEPNPAPVKAALAARHDLHNELRAPMTQASEACAALVEETLAEIERRFPAR